MLKPHKFMDLKLSIINISEIIMRNFAEQKKYTYDDLYKKVTSEVEEEGVMEIFNLSLTFLYALNKITYHKELDILELL